MGKKDLPAGTYAGLFGKPSVKVDQAVKRPVGRPRKDIQLQPQPQPSAQGIPTGASASGSGTEASPQALDAPVQEEQNTLHGGEAGARGLLVASDADADELPELLADGQGLFYNNCRQPWAG